MTDKQISLGIVGAAFLIVLMTISVGVLREIPIPTQYWTLAGTIAGFWLGGKALNGGVTTVVKRLNGGGGGPR